MFVNDKSWVNQHLKIFKHYYSKSKFFHETYEFLQKVYYEIDSDNLSHINKFIIKSISKNLNLECNFRDSTTIKKKETDASERLLEICKSRNLCYRPKCQKLFK